MEGIHNLHNEWRVIKNKSYISVLWPCIQRSMSPLLKRISLRLVRLAQVLLVYAGS